MIFGVILSLSSILSAAFASVIQIREQSPITLDVTKISNYNSIENMTVADRQRARVRHLVQFSQSQSPTSGSDISAHLTDSTLIFVADVGVGGGFYRLLLDTASSNIWVGANQPYNPGPESKDTGSSVHVTYSSGSFSGEEFTDEMLMGFKTLQRQSLGVATNVTGFNLSSTGGIPIDGVFGVGPPDLTRGTVMGKDTIPTVTDNLKKQRLISHALVALSLAPTTNPSSQEFIGSMSFGTVDPSQFTGNITYTKITNTSPSNKFWGINQSIAYGTTSNTILRLTAGIMDMSNTFVLLATDAFQAYKQATEAELDYGTGLLKVEDPSKLKSLFFQIEGTDFEFTANAQIWPHVVNHMIGGKAHENFLVIADLGTPSGQGLDFVLGMAFSQRFYTVYDTENGMVGFATTPHTEDTTN